MEYLIQFLSNRNGNILKENLSDKKRESIKLSGELLVSRISPLIESGKTDGWQNCKCLIRLKFENVFYDLTVVESHDAIQNEKEIEIQRKKYGLLTKRERAVLCFISKGYKQDEIAFCFSVSVNTIRKQRRSVYEKLNFRSQVQIALWCERYLLLFFRVVDI